MFSILLFNEILVIFPNAVASALAAQPPPPAPGVVTLQQFMKLGRDGYYHGPLLRQYNDPNLQTLAAKQKNASSKMLSSAEPAKMQPIHLALSSSFLIASQTAVPLKQLGSDQRLEVQLAPGALDVSNVHINGGAAPANMATTGLILQITQRSGHYVASTSVLGTYDLNVVDSQGHIVQGVNVHKSVIIVYHYQPQELKALGLDPSRIVMTWPGLISAAQKSKRSTSGLVITMKNDAKNHTLTAQSTVLGSGIFALGGNPTVQKPPTPNLASVEGNTGNLEYSYPLKAPPGPGGFSPQLAFGYSSSIPNGNHSPISPANYLGDGWALGMGSISADTYPDGSAGGQNTWYSLSGIKGVSDRLVPDSSNVGFFQTQHISHARILGLNMNSVTDTPSCFHVWDTSGTYYEFGCTPDALQYMVDSDGVSHTYRWDLNLIVAPHEGPDSPTKQITISYFQDMANDATGYDSVRDAVMAQVVYETVNPSANPPIKVVGTIDFQYRAPAIPSSIPTGTSASWIVPYGPKYNCNSAPLESTTLRCDNPIDYSSTVKAPAVMSTFSLQQVTSYVGSDTANHPAYGYMFKYVDTPFTQINDPITLAPEYAAGEHLLTNIIPIEYLGGTAHQLKKVVFSYNSANDSYYDGTQTGSDGTTNYSVQTNWQYLTYYVDQNTNIGENITYKTAYGNPHGTPYVTDSGGNIVDDRHDPFYCTNHANDTDTSKRCTGDYAHPDDYTWSVQVVTVRSAVGKDSSDTNLQPATYNYNYMLGAYGNYQQNYGGNGSFCTPAGDPIPPGQDDCVYDTYIPGDGGGTDQVWQDYYHGEFRGFKKVYTTPPDGNLTVQTYYTPEAWGTPSSDSSNYQSGMLMKADLYWGTQEIDGQLINETINHYAGTADFLPQGSQADSTACYTNLSNVFTPCEPMMLFTKTTTYEQNGTAIANAPWVQTTYSYDDYSATDGLNTAGDVYHNALQVQISS